MGTNKNFNAIPEEAGFSEDVKVYNGSGYPSYSYFGNCCTTVIEGMWDATQMAQWLASCDIIPTEDVVDKLFGGSKSLPKRLIKAINKLKLKGKLNDTGEIVCGIDDYQEIMFIYVPNLDIHYFFDCD